MLVAPLQPLFLLLSLTCLLVHATRGLHPMFGPGGERWVGFKDGVFTGKYQVAKDLSPSELKSQIKLVAEDVMGQVKDRKKYAPSLQLAPRALSAYMGERGVLAFATSGGGTGNDAEVNMKNFLGASFRGGIIVSWEFSGGSKDSPGRLMPACKICSKVLADAKVKDAYAMKRKRAHTRDVVPRDASPLALTV